MKIVQFNDGTYAVRRWRFGWEYLDNVLYNRDKWWPLDCKHRATVFTYAKAANLLDRYKTRDDIGTPVKQGLEIG